jgi:hypothetical protein
MYQNASFQNYKVGGHIPGLEISIANRDLGNMVNLQFEGTPY